MARRIFEKLPARVRFWQHVQPGSPDECWLWNNGATPNEYGQLYNAKGPKIRSHRLSFEMHHGPIPKGMHVCHRCDVKACVNPAHLFVGTQQDNMRDMHAKGRGYIPPTKDHCKYGHPLQVTNGFNRSGSPAKICRVCARQRERDKRADEITQPTT